MIAGTAYGVVLNDRDERERLAPDFARPPYAKPPVAPVLYIKPRNTLAASGGRVTVPGPVTVAATLALLFADRPGVPAAIGIAADIFEPHDSYYRPAIRQKCRDGFLPLGRFAAWDESLLEGVIVTSVDGREVHRWSLSRLVRAPLALIAELGTFMTLSDGDVLLVGLAGDAPLAAAGQRIAVAAGDLPPLSFSLVAETDA